MTDRLRDLAERNDVLNMIVARLLCFALVAVPGALLLGKLLQ